MPALTEKQTHYIQKLCQDFLNKLSYLSGFSDARTPERQQHLPLDLLSWQPLLDNMLKKNSSGRKKPYSQEDTLIYARIEEAAEASADYYADVLEPLSIQDITLLAMHHVDRIFSHMTQLDAWSNEMNPEKRRWIPEHFFQGIVEGKANRWILSIDVPESLVTLHPYPAEFDASEHEKAVLIDDSASTETFLSTWKPREAWAVIEGENGRRQLVPKSQVKVLDRLVEAQTSNGRWTMASSAAVALTGESFGTQGFSGCSFHFRNLLKNFEEKLETLVFEENPFSPTSEDFKVMQQRMNRLFFRRHLSKAQERLQPWKITVPRKLMDTTLDQGNNTSTYHVSSLYNKLDNTFESQQYLIEGNHGSGKSTVLKQLYRQSFENASQLLPILIDFRQIDLTMFDLTTSFLKQYVMRSYGYTEVEVKRFFDDKKLLWLMDNINDCHDTDLRERLLSGEEEGMQGMNVFYTAKPDSLNLSRVEYKKGKAQTIHLNIKKYTLQPWNYAQAEKYLKDNTPASKNSYASLVIHHPSLQAMLHEGDEPLIEETRRAANNMLPRTIAASPAMAVMLTECFPLLLKKPKNTWPKTARELYDFYVSDVLALSSAEKATLQQWAIAPWQGNIPTEALTRDYAFLSPIFSTTNRYAFTDAGWQDYWIAEKLWEERHNPSPDSLWNLTYWIQERPGVLNFLKERFAKEPDGLTSAQQLWHQWIDTESYKILYQAAPNSIAEHCIYLEKEKEAPHRLKYTFKDAHHQTQLGYLTPEQLGHDYDVIQAKIDHPNTESSPLPTVKAKIMACIQENGHLANTDKAHYNVSALLRETVFQVEQQGDVFINPANGLPLRWKHRESTKNSQALIRTDSSPVTIENQQAYVISRSNREMRLATALNLDDEAQFKLYGNLKYPVGIAGHACYYMDEAQNINGRHFIAVSALDRELAEQLRETLFREMWAAKENLDLEIWVPSQWGIYEKATHELHLHLNNEALYYGSLERYTQKITMVSPNNEEIYPILDTFFMEEKRIFVGKLKSNPIYRVHEDPERDSMQSISEEEIERRWKKHEERIKTRIQKLQKEIQDTDDRTSQLQNIVHSKENHFRIRREYAENQSELIKKREENMIKGSCDRFRLLSEAYEVTQKAYQAYPSEALIALHQTMSAGNLNPAIEQFQRWFALNAETDFLSTMKATLWKELSQWISTQNLHWLRRVWALGGQEKMVPIFFSGEPASYRQFFKDYSQLLRAETSEENILALETAWNTGGISALETLLETHPSFKEEWQVLSETERQEFRQDMTLLGNASERARKVQITDIVNRLTQNIDKTIEELVTQYQQQWLACLKTAIEAYTQQAGTHKTWKNLSSERQTALIQQLSTAICSPEQLQSFMVSQPHLFPQISSAFIERFLRLGLGVDIANKNHESGLFWAIRAVIHHREDIAKQKRCYDMVAHWANCGATVGMMVETASRETPYCSLLTYLREHDLGTVEWENMMQALNGIHIVFEQHAQGEKALHHYVQEIKKIVATYDQKYELAGFTSLAAVIQYFSLMMQPIFIKNDRFKGIFTYPREAGLLLLHPYELLAGIKRIQERYTNFEKRSLGTNHSALHDAIRECTEAFIEKVELGEYLASITPESQQELLPSKYRFYGYGSWFSSGQRRKPSISFETNTKLRKSNTGLAVQLNQSQRKIEEKDQEIQRLSQRIDEMARDSNASSEVTEEVELAHTPDSANSSSVVNVDDNAESIIVTNPLLPLVVDYSLEEASAPYLPIRQTTLSLITQAPSENEHLRKFIQGLGLSVEHYTDELDSTQQLTIHFLDNEVLHTNAGTLFLLQHPEKTYSLLALEPANGENVIYVCQIFPEGNSGRQFVFLSKATPFLEEKAMVYPFDIDRNRESIDSVKSPLHPLKSSSVKSASIMHHSTHFRTQTPPQELHQGSLANQKPKETVDASQGVSYNK